MKNFKTSAIVVLIISNTLFIGAYAKKQDEVKAAQLIAEDSRQKATEAANMARHAQQAAQENEEHAKQVVELSNERVELLSKQLEDCRK